MWKQEFDWLTVLLSSRWLNKLGLASIQYEPTDRNLTGGKHHWPPNVSFCYLWQTLSKENEIVISLWIGIVSVWPFGVYHTECYSEASDHEEAESTDLPPPPYSEQTLRDSVGASGPPGSTHQVSHRYHVEQLERSISFTLFSLFLNWVVD